MYYVIDKESGVVVSSFYSYHLASKCAQEYDGSVQLVYRVKER